MSRPNVLSASTMLGDSVRNAAGEKLGTLEELMIDLDTGSVAYAVLSFGGIFGMGDKLFAFPWQALGLDTENKEFVLDIDRETLEKAPGFDKDDWPETIEQDWLLSIYDYYGYEPYWES